MTLHRFAPASAALLLAIASACGGSHGPTSPAVDPLAGFPSGALSLTVSPVDLSAVRLITPLGNLNPPSHVLPADHIYFYTTDPTGSVTGARADFRAPGDGTINWMLGTTVGAESKIVVRQTTTFSYYLDHLILTTPLTVGMTVKAGQVLGTTGFALAVDLGVINDAATVPFLVPSRYESEMLHTDAPLKYYAEPLRSQLYAKVARLGTERDGNIMNDVAGRLAGNWFGPDGTAMSFAYDTYDPAEPRIALASGTMQGVYALDPNDPRPRDVSVASGKVIYTLYNAVTGTIRPDTTPAGTMIVQLIDDAHIRWETFYAFNVRDFVNPRTSAR